MPNKIFKIFLITVIFLLLPNFSQAANFPLEITNIKPAGTGSPAIPATNRIFRAYPGIEYNIRAAVIGGLYPFKFSLANAPSGMTINENTGEISWPIPQSDANNISLSVTDAENTTVSTSWSITVSTNGFYFVDSNAPSGGNGTISSPINSLASLQAIGNATGIVYFRAGDYQLTNLVPTVDANGCYEMGFGNAPSTWLSYPGEAANILGNHAALAFNYVYMDGLNFSNFNNNFIMIFGQYHNSQIRRSNFIGLTTDDANNNNPGGIMFEKITAPNNRYYFVVQDNEFNGFTTAAVGSIYDSAKMLIEDNYIHGDTCDGNSLHPCVALAVKTQTPQITIRHNKIIMTDGTALGLGVNSQMADTTDFDVSFNFFNVSASSRVSNSNHGRAHAFNAFGYGTDTQTNPNNPLIYNPLIGKSQYYRSSFNLNYYRNTVIGRVEFNRLNGGFCGTAGPFNFSSNVMINSNADYSGWDRINNFFSYDWDYSPIASSPWLCINDSNNLKALPSANVIDANGNLTNRTKVGIYGWEVASAPTTYSIANFIALVANWLKTSTSSDVNSDDMVNAKDLGIMMSKWD